MYTIGNSKTVPGIDTTSQVQRVEPRTFKKYTIDAPSEIQKLPEPVLVDRGITNDIRTIEGATLKDILRAPVIKTTIESEIAEVVNLKEADLIDEGGGVSSVPAPVEVAAENIANEILTSLKGGDLSEQSKKQVPTEPIFQLRPGHPLFTQAPPIRQIPTEPIFQPRKNHPLWTLTPDYAQVEEIPKPNERTYQFHKMHWNIPGGKVEHVPPAFKKYEPINLPKKREEMAKVHAALDTLDNVKFVEPTFGAKQTKDLAVKELAARTLREKLSSRIPQQESPVRSESSNRKRAAYRRLEKNFEQQRQRVEERRKPPPQPQQQQPPPPIQQQRQQSPPVQQAKRMRADDDDEQQEQPQQQERQPINGEQINADVAYVFQNLLFWGPYVSNAAQRLTGHGVRYVQGLGLRLQRAIHRGIATSEAVRNIEASEMSRLRAAGHVNGPNAHGTIETPWTAPVRRSMNLQPSQLQETYYTAPNDFWTDAQHGQRMGDHHYIDNPDKYAKQLAKRRKKK
jgi:hypothetical protein